MRKSSLVKNLEKEAARLFHRTRNVKIRFDSDLEQIELMSVAYGDRAVLDDFKKWADDISQECRFPLAEYLKVVDERLGTKAQGEDTRIAEVTNRVYETVEDIPSKAQVRRLLELYPVEDILEGFGEFVGGVDKKMHGADIIKKFFSDGGAEAVITKLYKDSEHV